MAKAFAYPLSSSYKKLFISDILKCVPEPIPDNSHILMKTQILGIVIGIVKYQQRSVFSIDDGTGVLECVLWHKDSPVLEKVKELQKDIEHAGLSDEVMKCASAMLEKAGESIVEGGCTEYDHGDVISCLGSIRTFRGKLQLEIHRHYAAPNVNSESLWILDVIATKQAADRV